MKAWAQAATNINIQTLQATIYEGVNIAGARASASITHSLDSDNLNNFGDSPHQSPYITRSKEESVVDLLDTHKNTCYQRNRGEQSNKNTRETASKSTTMEFSCNLNSSLANDDFARNSLSRNLSLNSQWEEVPESGISTEAFLGSDFTERNSVSANQQSNRNSVYYAPENVPKCTAVQVSRNVDAIFELNPENCTSTSLYQKQLKLEYPRNTFAKADATASECMRVIAALNIAHQQVHEIQICIVLTFLLFQHASLAAVHALAHTRTHTHTHTHTKHTQSTH